MHNAACGVEHDDESADFVEHGGDEVTLCQEDFFRGGSGGRVA